MLCGANANDRAGKRRLGMRKKDGKRETVFGNAAVRAGEGHSLEMHIDTDGANAAGLIGGDILQLIKKE